MCVCVCVCVHARVMKTEVCLSLKHWQYWSFREAYVADCIHRLAVLMLIETHS